MKESEKKTKIIKLCLITYLIGITPSFIIVHPDLQNKLKLILIGLFGPAAAFSVLITPVIVIYFITIHKRFENPNSEKSYNAQWVAILITLIVSVIFLWIYALIIVDFLDFSIVEFYIEEYFYENQIEEINSDESLENLKDGEFTEENFEPVE